VGPRAVLDARKSRPHQDFRETLYLLKITGILYFMTTVVTCSMLDRADNNQIKIVLLGCNF